ncbi:MULTISPECIES: phenylacetic acid degradation protein PaaY [Niveispirillum]|uniref:Phenylacetic acid degradation protein PaaY n=2 Tax=Niveispirillum TaxID=1543704 RepID=A0A255Z6J1_9PROT|nr:MULTISPECIES: phenylacetic acid degradation protein PaaY [Niveispirillum]AUN31011.1 phenylacetic acid degradation protein PaaY [Niveispirillum cyanobacteriorum]OYQ37056.1 phenylacetic acid degradation protein PaaY [Niveispirillum lacus]GGE87851.1 phenylacetic acid degradation protein PaaY [Niveispirillum cyanobacteriorum]
MPCYSFAGLVPVVDPAAFVHPTAVLIGDVIVGPGCYIGPGAALRGDLGRLIVQRGANVQDNCVMHSFPGKECVVEEDGHVGHGAVLHGCRVGRNALVGMNAVVMDNAVVGEEALVAAMSFVKAGMQIPPRVMVAGTPARVVRELTKKEIEWKSQGTAEYREIARRCLATLAEVTPLTEMESDRPRLGGGHVTLAEAQRN